MADSSLIAGLDEVGLGSLAGPILIAVAAFPTDMAKIPGVRDSKKCSWEQLQELGPRVVQSASFIGVGTASARMINTWGVSYAWQHAAREALLYAPKKMISRLIVDGQVRVDYWDRPQQVTPKADANFWQVSAASIVAKLSRDTGMIELAEHYQGYGWESNVGYGTAKHVEAAHRLGLTPYHRTKYTQKAIQTMLKRAATRPERAAP